MSDSPLSYCFHCQPLFSSFSVPLYVPQDTWHTEIYMTTLTTDPGSLYEP